MYAFFERHAIIKQFLAFTPEEVAIWNWFTL